MNNRWFLLAIAVVSMSGASEASKTRTLLGGIVTILVPGGLAEQKPDPEDSVAPDGPSVVYASVDMSAALAIGHQPQFKLKPELVPTLVKSLEQQYHYARNLSAGVRRINGRDFAVIESQVDAPEPNYFIAAQTSWQNHLLYVTFTCNPRSNPQCAAVGNAVVASIHLRD